VNQALSVNDQGQLTHSVGQGLVQAERLREFVADAAGTEHGAGHGVFGDLQAIDDMASDLERVEGRLEGKPDRPLSPQRAAAVAKTLARLELWTNAMEAGEVRAGEFILLEASPPNVR
jgi:hypothetical protein